MPTYMVNHRYIDMLISYFIKKLHTRLKVLHTRLKVLHIYIIFSFSKIITSYKNLLILKLLLIFL